MKRIVLASGGLDSSTLLTYYLCNDTIALFFNYGQKSYEQEKGAIENITNKLGIPLVEKDIREVFSFSKSDLLKHNKNTNKEYEVECRNFVFVSIATSIAMQLYQNEKVEIALGLIKICVNYSDCSKEFLNKCNELTRICTNGKVKVVAPFIEWGKDKVLDFLKATKILPKDTWSCYYGNEEPCGNCPACNDRKYLGV